MTLKTFFLDIASRGPLLVSGQDAYLVTSTCGQSDYISFRNSEANLGLAPAGKLFELVRFYKHIRGEEIYSIKKKFIEEKIKQGFRTAEERKKEIGDRKLFAFIIKELMPHMSGHKEDLSDLLGEEVRKYKRDDTTKDVNEEELLAALEQTKNELRREREEYGKNQFAGKNKDEISFLLGLTGGDIFTLGNIVYRLEKVKQQNADIKLSIGKAENYRKLKPIAKISEIESKYSEFMEWVASLEAIEEFSDYLREVHKMKLAAIKDFDTIMKLEEFNDGDVGFLNKRDDVYIYQIIPSFAMLDPRPTKKDICYEFPRLRVGIKIQYANDCIHLNSPILFEAEWHPFTSRKDVPFQSLCGGNIPSKDKYSEVEWVAKALDDGKNLVMHGLTPKSIRDHGGDRNSGGNYFGDPLDTKLAPRKTTIKEAKKKSLLLTNKWEWEKD